MTAADFTKCDRCESIVAVAGAFTMEPPQHGWRRICPDCHDTHRAALLDLLAAVCAATTEEGRDQLRERLWAGTTCEVKQ